VMLHFGQQDLVSRLKPLKTPGLRDKIDALGRAARENDFVRTSGINELGCPGAGGFECCGGAVAELMDAAMDVCIVLLVVTPQRLNDGARLLSRGRVIEVDQWMAVDVLVQNREIGAKA